MQIMKKRWCESIKTKESGNDIIENDSLQTPLVQCLYTTNALDWLTHLAKAENCCIIAAVKDTSGFWVSDELDKRMKNLGFRISLREGHWRGYVGVLENRQVVFEHLSEMDDTVYYESEIEGKTLKVKSSPFRYENVAKIIIDKLDWSVNDRGINIVVYDKTFHKVIDSVCIDSHEPLLPMCHLKLPIPYEIVDEIESLRIQQRELQEEIHCLRKKQIRPDPRPEESETRCDVWQEYRDRLNLVSLFENKDKVKVVFIYPFHDTIFWNTVQPLLLAFQTDNRFSITVICEDELFARKTEKIGIDYCYLRDYLNKKDQYDIAILGIVTNFTYEMQSILKKIRDLSKFFVCVSFGLVGCYGFDKYDSLEIRTGMFVSLLKKYNLKYIFWDSLIYKKLKEIGCDMTHCIEMGNPKFDTIYNKFQQPYEIPNDWEKILGKKIFLWATDHIWDSPNCTFDQYAKIVFQYFLSHPDLGLIFRPHPILFQEYIEMGILTQNEINSIKNLLKNTPNMIFDDTSDYSIAYDMATAIITDAECGITVSALTTKKPLCVFFRMGIPKYIEFPELINSLYQVQGEEECIAFFEMIQRGEDPLKQKREQAFQNCICHFDGKNTQRMKDFIVEKFFEEHGFSESSLDENSRNSG